ncbi:HTH-type transcriptional activator RhaS [Pseudomonas fluorescens]|uniref:HTH-type transcriptional activator RhaS n=2 Tax=Pseudomonas fluorescens TaxID=294 RepID=A0A5E7MQ18_PSEFL|nr:HTH-type transcriptional activator RhaS [Pseudomonas fluorescens]
MMENFPMPIFRFLAQTGGASMLFFRRNIVRRTCLSRSAPIIVGMNAQSPSKGCLSQFKEHLAKSFILSMINDQVNISDVAAACSLSRSYFSRAFKKSTGLSPQQWVISLRVERARLLLQMTELSLTEIGLECGFSDQSHFTKTFSKKVGVSPRHWRCTNRMNKSGWIVTKR